MLRRTHHEAVYNSDQVIEAGLRKYATVVTKDEDELGVALRLHLRPAEDVNPDLKLYPTYLEIQTVELGGSAFIPLEFVTMVDPANQRVMLEATLETVKDEVWNRKPDFIARGLNTRVDLPA